MSWTWDSGTNGRVSFLGRSYTSRYGRTDEVGRMRNEQKIQQVVSGYKEKYQIEVAKLYGSLTSTVRTITNYDVLALGDMLGAFDEYIEFVINGGEYKDLVDLEKFARIGKL